MAKYSFDRWSRAVAKVVGTFAPGLALGYLARRKTLAQYTAARNTGPDKPWSPGNKSADSILLGDRAKLMARARDLERNSPHIAGGLNKICNNVIFTGIPPQIKMRTPDGLPRVNINAMVEDRFSEWSEAVDFYEKQELALRHLVTDGEILIHRFFDRSLADRGIVPLGIELFEADYIDSSVSGIMHNGFEARAGIEYDAAGRPAAYHIYKEHPGDSYFTRHSGQVRRIPASDICHVFHPRRASQGRGVSWLASIILEMRDFTEYQNNERIAARLMSAFGIFLETPYPEHQNQNPLFQGGTDTGDEGAETETSKYIDPGRIDTLPVGCKPHAFQFNRPGNTYAPFTKISLKSASAGTGLSYETFSNDFEGATFSSARQGVLEERRGYRKVQTFLNRKFNSWIFRSWRDFAELSKIFFALPAHVPVEWQNPGWEWVDPAKDAKGDSLKLEMKITTRRRLAAEKGLDWDDIVEELAAEEAILKEKGLNEIPENTGGAPVEKPEPPEPDDK